MSAPDEGAASRAARAELQKAQAVLEADPALARRCLLEARHLDPGDEDIAGELARLELRLGLYAEALESLGRARVLGGDRAEWSALSGLCRLRLRCPEEAESLAEEALAEEPGNRVALEVRADCRRLRGDWPGAAGDVRALLAVPGAWTEAARARLGLKLAHCLLGQGAHAAAWDLTEDLRRRGYDGPPVRALRQDCERGQRGELHRAFGGSGWWGQVQWWLAGRRIVQALSLGSRRGSGRPPADVGQEGGGEGRIRSDQGLDADRGARSGGGAEPPAETAPGGRVDGAGVRVLPLLLLGLACLAPRWARAFETAIAPAALTGTAVVAQDYTLGYVWRQDADGCLYGPFLDLDVRQKLFRNCVAEGQARVFKAASSDGLAEVYLEQADAAYVGSWFTLAGGRRDLEGFLGPGSFFGAYSTMGERWLDGAEATIPFRFFAEIPDADAQVTAPYNALSVLYVPNLFEADQSDSSGRQGLVLSQLRVKFRVGGGSCDLFVNGTYGLDDWFLNSPVDEAPGLDASAAFRQGGMGLWGEAAVQNLEQGQGTAVAALGGSLDLSRWCRGLLRTLRVEVQIPLGDDPDNPFTGGDPQDPSLAQSPQTCWFVGLDGGLDGAVPRSGPRLFYGGALTNSMGDYTLARLSNGVLSAPLGSGFGVGDRVEDFSLRAANYQAPAGILYAGYAF